MDEEEIEHYTTGDIPEEECARVEEHLLICEECRQRVETDDLYVHAMRGAAAEWRGRPPVEQRAPRHTGWWWPRLVPAMLAAALLALVVWQAGRGLERRAPVFAVSLAAVRGSNPAAQAPAGRPLDLELDLNALPAFDAYGVQVVDGVGNRVWQGSVSSGAACRIAPLSAGTYFVRVSSPSGELLREYALETR